MKRGGITFIGECWPGDSSWIDFFNPLAVKYWQSLYDFKLFNGTNEKFGYWIDMNEPSVFSGPELTLPKNVNHRVNATRYIPHREVHNAYGAMS